MEVDILSWLSLAIRWFHVLIGILWIGASFYFVWLDNSLRPPVNSNDDADGELWAVHGGGFYHNKKYMVAPKHMPENLHWFKWEAYLTWVSGIALLSIIYYFQADIFLIDSQKFDILPWQAITLSFIFIAGGFILYEVLCEFTINKNSAFFGMCWFLFLTCGAFVLCQIFSDRAAFIHIGAIIGTVMAANVFVTIIPNQKKVVAALVAGESPDPELGLKAKQRSMHNNYMTLPVLLIMISNHYPLIFSHNLNWLLLACLCAVSLPLREFYNQRHKGVTDYRYIASGFLGFLIVVALASHVPSKGTKTFQAEAITDKEVKAIINKHCISCHSDTPTHEAYDLAPAGVTLDKLEEIKKYRARIYQQAVLGQAMPQGNESGMTEKERETLGAWINSQ